MKQKILKLNSRVTQLVLAFMLLGLGRAQAQWQTVLDYQLVAGKSADGDGIVADTLANVFSGGNGSDAAGTNHGLVLKTDTTQNTWLFSDDTNPDSSRNQTSIWNMGLDTSGNVYSIGQLTPAGTNVPYWYVRKSADSGVTWSTADLYQYVAGQWVDPTGFAADNAGHIYVVGWGRDAATKRTPSNIHWLVRRSSDAGQTWTLVDDVLGTSGAHAAGFVPGVGVFVVGVPYPGSSSAWLVRRSITGDPGTWSTVDGPISGGAAQGICSDSGGNIYVAGAQFITTGTKPRITGYRAWVIRKSSDGGNTWSNVDSFSYAQSQSAGANAIGRNATGGVAAVGYANDAQGLRHWIVRTSDTSGVWQTLDDYQLSPGDSATATSVTSDTAGHLLVTGNAANSSGYHWIARRF